MTTKNDWNLKHQDILREFRKDVFYEDLYKKYEIDQKDLIGILKRSIKGRYNYQRILSGGLIAQRQFNKHLNNRWNPLEPGGEWVAIKPYIDSVKKKEPVNDKNDE